MLLAYTLVDGAIESILYSAAKARLHVTVHAPADRA
jgi:hypothetical protein